MKKAMPAGRQGFTLIELLVVIAVFGLILVTTSTILINSVRAKNRVAIVQDLEVNGSSILNNIKYNLLNADPGTIICPNGPQSLIKYYDKTNPDFESTINCAEGTEIASSSSLHGKMVLSSPTVQVSGCDSFVNCISDNGQVTSISIGFSLAAGLPNGQAQDSVARGFNTMVTVR